MRRIMTTATATATAIEIRDHSTECSMRMSHVPCFTYETHTTHNHVCSCVSLSLFHSSPHENAAWNAASCDFAAVAEPRDAPSCFCCFCFSFCFFFLRLGFFPSFTPEAPCVVLKSDEYLTAQATQHTRS